MSKVFVSEAVWRVVDRCVQVLGGQGVTGETLVARLFNEVREKRGLAYSVYTQLHEFDHCPTLIGGATVVSRRSQ